MARSPVTGRAHDGNSLLRRGDAGAESSLSVFDQFCRFLFVETSCLRILQAVVVLGSGSLSKSGFSIANRRGRTAPPAPVLGTSPVRPTHVLGTSCARQSGERRGLLSFFFNFFRNGPLRAKDLVEVAGLPHCGLRR